MLLNHMKIGDMIVSNNIITSVTGFIFLYFISIVILVFALLLSGLDFITAFSAIITCFNNAGPGLNEVGPATNLRQSKRFSKSRMHLCDAFGSCANILHRYFIRAGILEKVEMRFIA